MSHVNVPSLPPGCSPLMWGVVFPDPALWAGFLPVQHPNQHSFGTKSSRWRPSCTSQDQNKTSKSCKCASKNRVDWLAPLLQELAKNLWQPFCIFCLNRRGVSALKIHSFIFSRSLNRPLNQASTWAGPEWRSSASPCAFWCPYAQELWRVRALQWNTETSECHFDLIKRSTTSSHIFTFWIVLEFWHILNDYLRQKLSVCHLVSSEDHICQSQGSM